MPEVQSSFQIEYHTNHVDTNPVQQRGVPSAFLRPAGTCMALLMTSSSDVAAGLFLRQKLHAMGYPTVKRLMVMSRAAG